MSEETRDIIKRSTGELSDVGLCIRFRNGSRERR